MFVDLSPICDRGFLSRRLCDFLHLWLVNVIPLTSEPVLSTSHVIAPRQLNSYTAIGDSFAAGVHAIPGAHLPWCNGTNSHNCTTDVCLKNVGSYPYQFSTSDDFDVENFQFLACAGSNTISCRDNQVNGLDFGTPDVVSVHIGGNNNDSFGPVMISCVYKRGWGCDEALKKAESTIANIGVHFDSLFEAIQAKPLRNGAHSRHVFAMGYPTFYNATAVGSCQSWQINWPSPGKDGMRQRLNDLIDAMNTQMRNATTRAGDGFHYVDTDTYFERHRLCDKTDDVWFQYLLEWGTTEQPAQTGIKIGPFHPNFAGQQAFLRALSDGIQKVQHDETMQELEMIT